MVNLLRFANSDCWTRTRAVIRFFPQLIIYGFLMHEFILNVIDSTMEYLILDTMVYVNYHRPELARFPAVTICGCVTQNLTCHNHEIDLYNFELEAYQKYSALEILQNQSFPMDGFIKQCHLIEDIHQPEIYMPCSELRPVVETYSFGRKCWTFFSGLSDNVTAHQFEYSKFKFSSQMSIEITFPKQDYKFPTDLSMALHSASMIPTNLDGIFYPIEPFYSYGFQFSERSVNLLPSPWITRCGKYPDKQRPRSKHECLEMCIARRTFNNQTKCLNYYAMFSAGMLEDAIGEREARQSKICPDTKNNLDYIRYVVAKSHCEDECQRDCFHQEYRITFDETYYIDATLEPKTIIMIWPEQAIVENFVHTEALTLFDFFGCLGGQAHIWLGLSAVQSYDVFVLIFGYFCNLANRIKLCLSK